MNLNFIILHHFKFRQFKISVITESLISESMFQNKHFSIFSKIWWKNSEECLLDLPNISPTNLDFVCSRQFIARSTARRSVFAPTRLCSTCSAMVRSERNKATRSESGRFVDFLQFGRPFLKIHSFHPNFVLENSTF